VKKKTLTLAKELQPDGKFPVEFMQGLGGTSHKKP